MKLFGFEFSRTKNDKEDTGDVSFVTPQNDDGSLSVTAGGGVYGTFIDLDGAAKNDAELISSYRKLLEHQEFDTAIDDIINEAIVVDYNEEPVQLSLDKLTEFNDSTKKRISEEFNNILSLMDFSNKAYEIFKKWYVDARLYYHVMIDESNPKQGITGIRYIDPRKIKKIRVIKQINKENYIFNEVQDEYYMYNDSGFGFDLQDGGNTLGSAKDIRGVRISKDSIAHITSGIMNENNTKVLSHLHKAIKPLNQLRMLEDATVIYRVSRAPERRIFYVDTGGLPKMKAEQYMNDIMAKHKNKIVYDSTTGEIRNDKKFQTMMEDFWMPRREGGKGTEISSLPGGQNLGELEDVLYFQKKLYKALNVPITRMESDSSFVFGRASEISRDELKFQKFIKRLQNKFSGIFDELLEKQLILKGVITLEEWPDIRNRISYLFARDNYYSEMKDNELLQARLQLLRDIEEQSGIYYSKNWIRKNVLFQTEEEIVAMKKEMEEEAKEEGSEDDEDEDNFLTK